MAIADNSAAEALTITQSGVTRVKEIIVEGVTKGWSTTDITKRLNKVIAETVVGLKTDLLKDSVRQALVTAARKWNWQLTHTYEILNRNLANNSQLNNFTYSVDLMALITNMRGNALDTLRQYVDFSKTAITPVIEDYRRSVKTAMRALAAEPPKVVQPRNGKAYVMPLRNFAETTIRYEANLSELQQLRDNDVRLVWTSSHPNASPRCAPFQGRLWSLDGTTGRINGISYAPIDIALKGINNDGNGIISGYNCRHRLVPYTKGSRAPREYTEEQILKEYALDKMQRRYENNIRNLKTEARLLRASGEVLDARKLESKARRLTKDYQVKSLEAGRAYYPYRYIIDKSEIEYKEIAKAI